MATAMLVGRTTLPIFGDDALVPANLHLSHIFASAFMAPTLSTTKNHDIHPPHQTLSASFQIIPLKRYRKTASPTREQGQQQRQEKCRHQLLLAIPTDNTNDENDQQKRSSKSDRGISQSTPVEYDENEDDDMKTSTKSKIDKNFPSELVVGRMLVNMLVTMTSPFPEIRSALKIRRRRLRKRRAEKSRLPVDNLVDEYKQKMTTTEALAAQATILTAASISMTSESDPSSNTNKSNQMKQSQPQSRQPTFIERYWKPLAGLLYVCMGVLVYDILLEKQQHWSFVDAIYFAMTCFTTVGYGDLVPTTYTGKFFTCVYGFTGIALLGALVASIGSKLVRLELDTVQNVRRQSRKQLMKMYDKMPHLLHRHKQQQPHQSTISPATSVSEKNTTTKKDKESTTIQRQRKNQGKRYLRSFWNSVKFMVSPLAVILTSGVLMGKIERWNILDSFYYALVTGTTIGLGDFSPRTKLGKMVAILVIPMLVGATGEILAGIGIALLRQRQKRIFDDQANGSLSVDDVDEMDEDNDGKVSKQEYTIYMLLQMDLVTRDEIDDLYNQFERLDVTRSGYIESEDLKVMAKIRQQQQS